MGGDCLGRALQQKGNDSFKKCGITVTIDGSEDSSINLKDIEDYVVGEDSDEEVVTGDEEATGDEEDPFSDSD